MLILSASRGNVKIADEKKIPPNKLFIVMDIKMYVVCLPSARTPAQLYARWQKRTKKLVSSRMFYHFFYNNFNSILSFLFDYSLKTRRKNSSSSIVFIKCEGQIQNGQRLDGVHHSDGLIFSVFFSYVQKCAY